MRLTTSERLLYIEAHKHCRGNREEIALSNACGCFYCLATFNPASVSQWADAREGIEVTALCPFCGINSVIGTASGFPVTEEFLEAMKDYWFNRTAEVKGPFLGHEKRMVDSLSG